MKYVNKTRSILTTMLLAFCSFAIAGTITVDSNSGDRLDPGDPAGTCTLRAAMLLAEGFPEAGSGCTAIPNNTPPNVINVLPSVGTVIFDRDTTISANKFALRFVTKEVTVNGNGMVIDHTDSLSATIIVLAGGNLTWNDITIKNTSNNFGAIYSRGGVVTINRSVFEGNAGNQGGSLEIHNGGTVNVNDSVFKNNMGIGAVALVGFGPPLNTLTIKNSTITGNAPRAFGSLFYLSGDAKLVLDHVTAYDNSAGSSRNLISTNSSNNSITITNSILGDYSDLAGCSPSIRNTGINTLVTYNNVASNDTCFASTTPGDNNDVVVTEAALNLLPLADNGGPTMTFALGDNSVAINHVGQGDGPACTEALDQRGMPRSSPNCDAGAFNISNKSPETLIAELVEACHECVSNGDLVGTTHGGYQGYFYNKYKAKVRLLVWKYKLHYLEHFIERGKYAKACRTIDKLIQRADGINPREGKRDFVEGVCVAEGNDPDLIHLLNNLKMSIENGPGCVN